ncbi:VOC family protein [Longimicrobium sp.]|uniref:VOC family protein n=1 Tax=Longimicrobium sp. TaxID=2029185 RepID=UPI002D1BCB07|nr:VOC family protein [Longimicrobium sp.]HSU14343.1 VOC family protein [Longimicrobium sp.]
MLINAYLGFDGDCAEAFRFYEQVLGGKIDFIMTYGETPMRDQMPPETHGRVVHVRMTVDGTVLMGGDAPPGQYEKPRGTTLNLRVDRIADAERLFNALSEGGAVSMPLQKTFWAERFAMFTDRFGTPWMVNCEQEV